MAADKRSFNVNDTQARMVAAEIALSARGKWAPASRVARRAGVTPRYVQRCRQEDAAYQSQVLLAHLSGRLAMRDKAKQAEAEASQRSAAARRLDRAGFAKLNGELTDWIYRATPDRLDAANSLFRRQKDQRHQELAAKNAKKKQ